MRAVLFRRGARNLAFFFSADKLSPRGKGRDEGVLLDHPYRRGRSCVFSRSLVERVDILRGRMFVGGISVSCWLGSRKGHMAAIWSLFLCVRDDGCSEEDLYGYQAILDLTVPIAT